MYTKYKYKHHTLIQVCIHVHEYNFEYNFEYKFEYNFEYDFEYNFEYNFYILINRQVNDVVSPLKSTAL